MYTSSTRMLLAEVLPTAAQGDWQLLPGGSEEISDSVDQAVSAQGWTYRCSNCTWLVTHMCM